MEENLLQNNQDPIHRKLFYTLGKIQRMFSELYTSVGAVDGVIGESRLATTLPINTEESVIAGESFTPQVTRKPSRCNIVGWNGNVGTDLSGVFLGFVKNGEFYDIRITAIEDEYTQVEVVVF